MVNMKLLIAIAIAVALVALVVAWKQGLFDGLLSKDQTYVAPSALITAVNNTVPTTQDAPISSTSQQSRFCDRSERWTEEYGDSIEDRMHHSGYSQFTANSLTSRYKASFS